MLKDNLWWFALALVGVSMLLFTGANPGEKLSSVPSTVDNVDLSRYTGRWYSIAHIPTAFERGCAAGGGATYKLSDDGKIEVLNECYNKQGALKVVRGKAWVPDPDQPAKLKVSFFQIFGVALFPGDYWILALGPDYSYAVVGHPSRKYGWILSRTPTLPAETLAQIRKNLESQGYEWPQFQLIDQSVNVTGSDS